MDLVAEFAALHAQLHESAGAQATPAVAKVTQTTSEVAIVTAVAGNQVRVQRQGQTTSTRLISVSADTTMPAVNARVLVTKLNGNINTALISGVVVA